MKDSVKTFLIIALYTDEDVMWIGGNGDIIYE